MRLPRYLFDVDEQAIRARPVRDFGQGQRTWPERVRAQAAGVRELLGEYRAEREAFLAGLGTLERDFGLTAQGREARYDAWRAAQLDRFYGALGGQWRQAYEVLGHLDQRIDEARSKQAGRGDWQGLAFRAAEIGAMLKSGDPVATVERLGQEYRRSDDYQGLRALSVAAADVLVGQTAGSAASVRAMRLRQQLEADQDAAVPEIAELRREGADLAGALRELREHIVGFAQQTGEASSNAVLAAIFDGETTVWPGLFGQPEPAQFGPRTALDEAFS